MNIKLKKNYFTFIFQTFFFRILTVCLDDSDKKILFANVNYFDCYESIVYDLPLSPRYYLYEYYVEVKRPLKYHIFKGIAVIDDHG